jgi:hypothetical protein
MVFAYVVFFLCVATRLTMGMDVDFLWLYFDGFWLWACVYNFGVEPVFPTLYFGDRLNLGCGFGCVWFWIWCLLCWMYVS